MFEEITAQAKRAVEELLQAAKLQAGDLFVIGCSSSEIVGEHIGKGSSMEAAEAAFDGIYPLLKERGMESPELELLSPEGALIRKEKLPAAPEQREEVLRSVLEDAEKIGKTEQDEGASRPAAGGDAEANTAGGRTER